MPKLPANPLVSVIVLNYNGSKIGQIFDDCISALLKTSYAPIEVIIVDNGSTDTSLEQQLRQHANDSRLIGLKLERNLGYAGGNNAAIERNIAKGDLLVFVNNDVVVEPNWLEGLVSVMVNEEDLAVCGPLEMNPYSKGLTSAGYMITMSGKVRTIRSAVKGSPFQVGYVNGACLMTRKYIFDFVGGFNPNFFMYFEEADFCARVRALGYKLVTVPSSRVDHYSERSVKTNKMTDYSRFLLSRNRFYYLYQNRQLSQVIVTLFVAIFDNLSTAIRFYAKRDYTSGLWTLRGVTSGIRGLKKGISKNGRRPFEDKFLLPLYVDFFLLLPKRSWSDSMSNAVMSKLLRNV
jgi:GT2 family glycosyltransferase